MLAYQIRQFFKPGEITPEEANRLGYELAMRFTKGKHAFTVSTHTDKAHIHNHIYFNSTTLDGTRKFKNFWFSGIALQRVSDLICLENGLSVIEKEAYRDRTKRTEYPKKETFRDSICAAIDTALAEKPKDFEELLKLLEQAGYECKHGKMLPFVEKARNDLLSAWNIWTLCWKKFLIAVLMGLRRSEIIAVKYSDIDYINRTLHVERQLGIVPMSDKKDFQPKTYMKQEIELKTESSDRIIPILDILFEAIIEERQKYEKNRRRRINDKHNLFFDGNYVCCSTYGKPRSKNFHCILQEAVKRKWLAGYSMA